MAHKYYRYKDNSLFSFRPLRDFVTDLSQKFEQGKQLEPISEALYQKQARLENAVVNSKNFVIFLKVSLDDNGDSAAIVEFTEGWHGTNTCDIPCQIVDANYCSRAQRSYLFPNAEHLPQVVQGKSANLGTETKEQGSKCTIM